MIKDLKDTKIPMSYSSGLYSEANYDIAAEHTDKILDVLVSGVTACLADIKSKDYPTAFVFKHAEKEFVIAAVVEYFKNEDDPSKPGNWNYSWTFDEKDIPENARICTPYDGSIASYFRSTGVSKYGMGFQAVNSMADIFIYLLRTISKWLDENAVEGEEAGVKLDNVIQFRVVIENGEKIKSAEPFGEIKQLIKDDAAIEK
jgi:hypothetical protein